MGWQVGCRWDAGGMTGGIAGGIVDGTIDEIAKL